MPLYYMHKIMWHMGKNLKGRLTEHLNASESETHTTVWITCLIYGLFLLSMLIMKSNKHYPGIPCGSKLITNSSVNIFFYVHTHITNASHKFKC